MDELKRRILEGAVSGEEVIKEFGEEDVALKKLDVSREEFFERIRRTQERMASPTSVDLEKITRLCVNSFYAINLLSRDFVLACHWDEPWRSRRKIKKELKGAIVGAEHIKTCAKCQELLPVVLQNLQSLIVQK